MPSVEMPPLPGIVFLDTKRGEMFLVDDAAPDWAGWLLYRGPEGQWVSLRQATQREKDLIQHLHVLMQHSTTVIPTGTRTGPSTTGRLSATTMNRSAAPRTEDGEFDSCRSSGAVS